MRDNHVSVRPIDLTPSRSITSKAVSRLMCCRARAIKLIKPDYHYDPFRTNGYQESVYRRMRAEAEQYYDADLNLFMTFSFSSYSIINLPVVHYCDRTYEHFLEENGRTPTRNDRQFIKIDRENIENADLVLTLNQHCRDFIQSRYNAKSVIFLRGGINTDNNDLDPDSLMAEKENSSDILFIGRGVYKRGVNTLIQAFNLFNERRGGKFTLHIVGVKSEELPQKLQIPSPNIIFYGYLDRAVPDDLVRYNELLRSAKLFVFPMRPGTIPLAIQEAQLHCTPIIISNVSNTWERVTNDHNGILVDGTEPTDFAYHMDSLIEDTMRWRRLARNAHESIKDLTWSNVAGKFLDIIHDINLIKPVDPARQERVHALSEEVK